MKRIKILKAGVITNVNQDIEQSDAQKDAWLAREIANGSFGRPGDFTVVHEDMTAEIVVQQAADAAKATHKANLVTLKAKGASLSSSEVKDAVVALLGLL